ncbi:transglycosylase-like protein with SLT domain [Salsuginibacillus halophilus]|uniref:Transglycosylase-like protein with SLT domain n=1 Tax=Salsuginibacillus halophilus TaxID=517424 RepID=A0A2P8HDV7_9BACI|nr:lytic transglycosylase domain-containing protein [Salsuginibacillus halophilus]PSL44405.1 transglycosylase-like protein with SLT domain [Salsuginibacillus halophilus]
MINFFKYTMQSENGAARSLAVPAGVMFFLMLITLFTVSLTLIAAQTESPTVEESTPEVPAVEPIPDEFMPVYTEAAEAYDVPWEMLAAIHRVETSFSNADPMVSEAGAVGHMQFMPCTWTGWSHPSCENLGEGDIPEDVQTDPEAIATYGGYGVDASGNGKADPFDIEDAVHSAAYYLAANGMADGAEEEALFVYNQADWYVEDVLHYAEVYSEEAEDAELVSAEQLP